MNSKLLTSVALAAFALVGTADAAAQETWKPLGTGLMRDDIITSVYILDDFYEFNVEIEESEQTPGRYRLVNAYIECPTVGPQFPAEPKQYLIIDASDPQHVYIEPGYTAYYIGQGQQMLIWSIAEDYYNNLYGNWIKADEENVCGKLDRGVITFPSGSLLMFPLDEDKTFDPQAPDDFAWRKVNTHGMFRVKLPGTPAYDVDLTMGELNEEGTGVNVNVTFPEDVDYTLVGAFEGEYTADMYTKVAAGGDEIVKIEKSGVATVPFHENGVHTVVAVPVIDGEAWPGVHITREWLYGDTGWQNIGTAEYTDAILSSCELNSAGWEISEYTYNVEVEQNKTEPWKIRLVDPYGNPQYPLATEYNYDQTKHHYLNLDMASFDCVRLEKTEDIGLYFSTGRMDIWSYVDRAIVANPFGDNISFYDAAHNADVPKGHYDPATRTVTFDKDALRIMFPSYSPYWYMANQNSAFKLVLPEGTEIAESPEVQGWSGVNEIFYENAPAEYYTPSGIRVENPDKGLYIVRQGSKTFKVMK